MAAGLFTQALLNMEVVSTLCCYGQYIIFIFLFEYLFFSSLGIYLKNGISGLPGNLRFNFVGSTKFFSHILETV